MKTSIKRFIAGLLTFVILGNHPGIFSVPNYVIPRAFAQGEETSEENLELNPGPEGELGIIAILTEKELISDFGVRSRIMTYAESAQSRMPHSKSVVIEVDKNESTFEIASMLEKLYFEGIDTDQIDGNPLNNNSIQEDQNQLIGVVIIGDVPIPVVHEGDGSAAPSIYPYTDFYRKKYIYNHNSDQFELNTQVSAATPEVWHGLIVPPSKDDNVAKDQLIEYFNKNYEFTRGNEEFVNFEKRMLYANFPAMEKQMNFMDYKNYDRYTKYMEEFAMNRYNKQLLKEFIAGVSINMGSPDSPIIDDASIEAMYDVHTENIFTKYAYNFAEALRIYRSGINEVVEKTGRWSANEVDSPESLIALRDEYAKHQLKQKQLMLEQEVNDFVEDNLNPGQRSEQVVTIARLKIDTASGGVNTDSNTFSFYSFIDGQQISSITNINECGIQKGQQRSLGETAFENNSVLVSANRMYNPETLLVPPEGEGNWKLEDQIEYKDHGGCTFNNSLTIQETNTRPEKCIAEHAKEPLLDVLGSIEVSPKQAIDPADRCDTEQMTFKLLDELQYFSDDTGALLASFPNTPVADIVEQAYVLNEPGDLPNFVTNESLAFLINQTYENLVGPANNTSIVQRSSYVVKELMNESEPLILTGSLGSEIRLSVETETKAIDSIEPHVEPTNETVKAIKHIGEPRVDPITGEAKFPQVSTPNTPSDGIRHLSFNKNGIRQVVGYMNLFRINGNNPGEVTGSLLREIEAKQRDLNLKTNTESELFEEFFVENSDVIEPLTWKASSIDQKLMEIIPKYVDQDSFMPTPNNNPLKSPQNKPTGYEVLHIVANGDAKGYEFGLNRSMQKEAPEIEDETSGTQYPESSDTTDTPDGSSGGGFEEQYMCGDPSGVEVWEWFDAIQCWVDEEILPAEELFSLSSMCSTAPIPVEEDEEESGDIFDQVLPSAADFNIEMKRKSLVVDQTEAVTISALNKEGLPLFGYIDMPIHFEMEDPSIGNFSNNDVFIFAGERTVEFTAKKSGSTEVTVTMGDLPGRSFTIDVYESIDIDWQANEIINNDRSEFNIAIELKNPNGGDILNINDNLTLGPLQPADGGFENSGQLILENGRGQIKFLPTPGKKSVSLISKDAHIVDEAFIIEPSSAAATQILFKTPNHIPIGGDVEIEAVAADQFGFTDKSFNGVIRLKIDEKSEDLGNLENEIVELENGKGMIKVISGNQTGELKIIAENPSLETAELNIPLLARVSSEKWKESYPQNLFASFIGFPAGDFTQEDYFGGTHLFNGKTEAVYSFLTAPTPDASIYIAPNHLVRTTKASQQVFVEFLGNEMLLQVFDRENMQTLVSKKMVLNFDEVNKQEETAPKEGAIHVETLDADHMTSVQEGKLIIKNINGNVIADIESDRIHIVNSDFKWAYQHQPEFNVIELELTDGLTTVARILMNPRLESLTVENFEEVNPSLKWNVLYGKKSTNDPTGLVFYERGAEIEEVKRGEFYGLEGEQKYLSLFASGINIGEAVKYNMPTNAILLGDPTIQLETRSNSSLNYNSATGEQIYQDPEGKQIVSIDHFNFNNDGHQDVAVLTEDGRVRLLEGGPTTTPYKDRGNLAFLADKGVELEAFDLEEDNYEDLIIATEEGRLGILYNDKEVITRQDHKLNIGKKMMRLLKADMDQDGFRDLVILDSRGDIYIFYYDGERGKFSENGKWIANYGYSLKLEENLQADLDIRYAGILEPQEAISVQRPPLENGQLGGVVSDDAALEFIERQRQLAEQAIQDPLAGIEGAGTIPKLPWSEADETETYFAPIEELNFLTVQKNVSNKDRPSATNVDLKEKLTYTIEITSGATLRDVVIADTIPDALTLDTASLNCLQGGCENVEVQQNSVRAFFSDLNLAPGQTTILTYDVLVENTPAADILVQQVIEPNENLADPNSIIDEYWDILVSPPYNNTGKMLIHYSTGPRTYELTQTNDPQPTTNDHLDEFGDLIDQLNSMDPENPSAPIFGGSFEAGLDELTGNNDCFEDLANGISCIEEGMDSLTESIGNFSCKGGGCFPTPFNHAFLVPPEFPLPAVALPATLPTPVGPMPIASFFGVPSIIGAANVPGPIMSQMRFYVSPTLTGGMGMAMCWGPYPFSPTVPPPVYPIPYPPPIGNCIVRAIEAESLLGPVCSEIQDGISAVMESIASGTNKINSTMSGLDNNPNIPLNMGSVGPNQGAGGLEISLQTNLGEATTFDPPVQSFSNIHIPSFDSIGGVISGWWDRQSLEITNKLSTLPTVTVMIPDVKTLFTLDAKRTNDRYDAWQKVQSGEAATKLASAESGEKSDAQKIREGQQNLSGSNASEFTQSIQAQSNAYNLSTMDGLYDVASTIPLINLNEKPIELRVPWLSAAEIQAWIIQAEDWLIYYEREYNRVRDKWEAISCDEQADAMNNSERWENGKRCAQVKIRDAFTANFEEVTNSVRQNIEVLESYLAYPRELSKFKGQMADYVRQTSCYLDVIAQMMSEWLSTIRQEMVAWAETILTIEEVAKNIQELFDLFVDFETSCEICTNERYANFGWWSLLGVVLPEIPVIEFPKIPDIVLDLSDFDGAINIDMPILNIRPEPIPLPPLPYITLPAVPSSDVLISLQPLPILPELPELPELPQLPPIPTLELPTLPPPPKLPDVGQTFDQILPLVDQVLNMWCTTKKSFSPVPEQMLGDQIKLLTNRPAYLTPLDIMKPEIPKITGFDVGFNEFRIETTIYLGMRINMIIPPLERFSDDLNAFSTSIQEGYNQAHADSIIRAETWIQENLDIGQDFIDSLDQRLEDQLGNLTEELGNLMDEALGDPLERADAWLRDREAEWEIWAEENAIDLVYEDYYSAINELHKDMLEWKNDDLLNWFTENQDWISLIDNINPIATIFEVANEENLGERMQEGLDFIADKLIEAEEVGPTQLERLYICIRYYSDCRENEEVYFGSSRDEQTSTDVKTQFIASKEASEIEIDTLLVQEDVKAQSFVSPELYTKQMFHSSEGEEIQALMMQIAEAIEEVNEAEPVEYTVLKEKFGVPDYIPAPRKTTVDKIRLMQEELIVHSNQLMAESIAFRNTNDPSAIAGVPPMNSLPNQLAQAHVIDNVKTQDFVSKEKDINTFTNALTPEELGLVEISGSNVKTPLSGAPETNEVKLEEQGDRKAGQLPEINPMHNFSGACGAAVCLPDPITNSPVPVIPSIDLINNSETLFMPNGHLIYSDGSQLYLKRDLTLDESEINTDTGNPRRFEFEEMSEMLNIGNESYEAVNMLQTSFAENQASSFSWMPVTNPNLYGYGIELERMITGHDVNRQDNQLTDTKFILLPPEDGFAPEVIVNGKTISFGTLVTSLEDEEEAARKFGVSPDNIVTGAEKVIFPTINNAVINVSENKAVYVDQVNGSSYGMEMENGYYHIKMTWFDERAKTATYNQNEILAPQIYAGVGDPIDISQTDIFYMPIFKERSISASEIFADLSDAYNYYWFIDPENNTLTPEVGDNLTIPAQDEEKNFDVKLVATQDINDENFERFEKTFAVEVYAPAIHLDPEQLNEGIISGNMTPISEAMGDDLSDIPFSVFRKRLGSWKNIGILRSENLNKTDTSPILGEDQSYYSVDANGSYYIEGFDKLDPSSIILKDHQGNLVATVLPGNGLIELSDPNFDLAAIPAGTETPTHIAIIKPGTNEILGNVYYTAEANTDIVILDSGLDQSNVENLGVTIGDLNTGDGIIAANIPGYGPSFPGGAAIFEEGTQTNIALIDTDGSIRLMKGGYELGIKNKDSENEPYIFQILNSGVPVFDIFIQANFDNLQIDFDTNITGLNNQLGLLESAETSFAQTPESPPVPEFQFETEAVEVTENPFPDLDENHPYFQQILDLYKARVVSGYGDGSFRPNQKLTRAEFIKIALGVTNCVDCTTPNEAIIAKYLSNPFPDVNLGAWYFYCISIAKELGMVTGYGDGFFRPDRNISRAEAAAVLLRQSGIPLIEAPENAFVDVPDYAWYVDYVYTAVEIGLIQNNNGFVSPDEEITRGEFAFMAAGVKDIKECRLVDTDDDGVPDWWEMTHDMDLFTPDAESACPCSDNPWPADTDGDGVRDICDLDIDNDSVLNPICILTETGQVDAGLLAAGAAELGEPVDNCIFTPNTDQADLDQNGIGDACEACPCVGNPNLNDTDGDGVRDVCDNDIDNDTVLHDICIFDDSGLLDPSKVGPGDDNCIFTPNVDQEDLDGNGVGDVCEALEEVDLCPSVPEDLDGVDDGDGCPEVNDDLGTIPPGTYVSPGEICGFIDHSTEFLEGDIFMTAITDLQTHEVVFSKSEEVTYQP